MSTINDYQNDNYALNDFQTKLNEIVSGLKIINNDLDKLCNSIDNTYSLDKTTTIVKRIGDIEKYVNEEIDFINNIAIPSIDGTITSNNEQINKLSMINDTIDETIENSKTYTNPTTVQYRSDILSSLVKKSVNGIQTSELIKKKIKMNKKRKEDGNNGL